MQEELFDLARRYARAADRKDADAYVGLFHPDGVISVAPTWDQTEIVTTISGHEALRATIAFARKRFRRTFHILGQASYEETSSSARGEVYCVANHLMFDGDRAENLIWYIRYVDTMTRDDAGRWLFAERHLHIDWTETRPAHHPDEHAPTTSILVPTHGSA